MKTLAAALLALVCATGAAHAEWRYCLAVSEDWKTAYFADPFETSSSLETLLGAFDSYLRDHVADHMGAQCPKASSRLQIEELRRDAMKFQTKMGARIRILHWPTDSSV